VRFLGLEIGRHVWRYETADLPRKGWIEIRECRSCHRVEESRPPSRLWTRVSGMELVRLRAALFAFRRSWVMVGEERVRRGAAERRARAELAIAERRGLS